MPHRGLVTHSNKQYSKTKMYSSKKGLIIHTFFYLSFSFFSWSWSMLNTKENRDHKDFKNQETSSSWVLKPYSPFHSQRQDKSTRQTFVWDIQTLGISCFFVFCVQMSAFDYTKIQREEHKITDISDKTRVKSESPTLTHECIRKISLKSCNAHIEQGTE